MPTKQTPAALEAAKEQFIAEWGGLGPAWGVNRTMSQIHALTMVSADPMNTDQIMEALGISRGNAHGNIQQLVSWGLLRKLTIKGERKDYYEAEKDVWRVVQAIVRERRRKEFEPVLATLTSCLESTKGLRDKESRAFRRQLTDLKEFASMGERVADRIGRMESTAVLRWFTRLLS